MPNEQPLATYDAGLLSAYGGGDVEWWQDYIRAELAHAHEFYESQWDARTPPPPTDDAVHFDAFNAAIKEQTNAK